MAGEEKQTKGIVPTFKFNEDQKQAYALATNALFKYLLFYGPSRSGKSFLILYLIFLRALRAPNSRHFIGRGARNACEDSLFKLTLIQVFDKCFPGLREQCDIKSSDMTVVFPNGSMIKFDGLDADRIDKVLGQEYNTIWINECNDDEVDYGTVSQLMTRLSMATPTSDGKMLVNKMFFDCNPKFFSDWEYKAFKLNINPEDGDAMPDPQEWAICKLNTTANQENLDPDYIKRLSRASAAKRQRFMLGEWCDENKSALFKESMFADHRIPKPVEIDTPEATLAMLVQQGIELERVTIAGDPAVTADPKSDLTGITVQGYYRDGDEDHVVVLDDLSDRYTPDDACKVIAQAYREWGASRVVLENNQGGLWLESTMRKHFPNVPLKFVNANSTTGGKASRAEPVAAQYERGVVHHVGKLAELEAQMCDFGSPASRRKSPDRMDAVVWGITELLDLNQEKKPDPSGGGAFRYRRLR
ncbi:phage terminase large subunit [Sphingobium xenophagum]|uniref:phage terminase large subunit n=1 Tax=Sphingobium xenophagum TaxID=121428 RepID=UPI001C0C27D2|nr:phage terminase large subunit [Sphingobium xenophagum]QWT14555.1 phage terminase large subunit [Sphingobium xenophagum]